MLRFEDCDSLTITEMQAELMYLGLPTDDDDRRELCRRLSLEIQRVTEQGQHYRYSNTNRDYRIIDETDINIIYSRLKGAIVKNNVDLLDYALPYISGGHWSDGVSSIHMLNLSLTNAVNNYYGPISSVGSIGSVNSFAEQDRRNTVYVVEALLRAGADPNEEALLDAVKTADDDVIQVLLRYGANPNYHIGSSSAFTYALRRRKDLSLNLVETFLQAGVDIHWGNALLAYTNRAGPIDFDILDVLLGAGATQEEINEAYRTATRPEVKQYLEPFVKTRIR